MGGSYIAKRNFCKLNSAQAKLESNGKISENQAYRLVSTDLEQLLGLRGVDEEISDLVAFDGGNVFDLSSKVVGVISPGRGLVDLF